MRKAEGAPRKRRGVVLITTLAIMMFMVMLSTMLITTSHNALKRASGYHWTSIACQTAVAGATFAQTCMQCDFGWMAARRTSTVIGPIQVGNMQVTQDFDKQTVQGFIFSEETGGLTGEFRISFRGGSTFPNDGTATTCLSCNNLGNDNTGTCSWDGNSRQVPKRTADVLVEGLCRSSANGAVLNRRVVEVGLYRDTSSLVNLAASGGDMVADIDPAGQWTVQMASGLAGNPGIRSMHNVEMYANDPSQFALSAGSIHLVNGVGQATVVGAVSGNSGSSLSPVDSSSTAKENAEQFTRIGFNQIKVTPAQTLSAGTYVFWDKTSSSPTYYQDLAYAPSNPNMTYEFNPDDHSVKATDASTVPPTVTTYAAKGTPSVPSSFWGPMSVNVNSQFDVRPTSYQDASGTTVTNSSLAIVADPTITDRRLTINFESGSGAVLQNSNDKGSITLRGEVNGAGSVLAKGDISFEGHSALTPNPNAVVTMYSGGDTTLQPILNGHGSVDTKSKSSKATAATSGTLDVSSSGVLFVLGYAQARVGAESSRIASSMNPTSPMPGVTYSKQPNGSVTASFDSTRLLSQGNLAEGIVDIVGEYNGESHGTNPDGYSDSVRTMLANASPPMTMADVYASLADLGTNLGATGTRENRANTAVKYIIEQSSTQPVSGSTMRQWLGQNDASGNWHLQMTTTGGDWSSTQAAQLDTAEVTDAKGNKKTVTVADQEFLGMIYACGNFTTNMPHTANVSVSGAVVAYGGDPSQFNANDSSTYPGANGTGRMLFSGKSVTFTYDPTYLGGLYNLFPSGRLLRSFFASY